jgi:hypothetical protein
MLIAKKLWPAMLGLSLVACGAPQLDESSVDDGELAIDDEKADGTAAVSTYYWVRPDLRRCASPMCGGYFVQRVNKSSTRCADGSYQESCYVADLDFGNQEPASTGLVRGGITKGADGYGLFTASEVYAPVSDSAIWGVELPEHALYKLRDRGLRCIKAPCPQYHRAKLNQSYHSNFDSIDLGDAGGTDEQQGAAYDSLYAGGLFAAGVVRNRGGSDGRVFVAELYLLAQPLIQTQKTCHKGGCSGQICSDKQGVISTCEWRAEYACYQGATCEVQADGNCGWTPSPTLTACLASPPPL